MLAMQLIRRRAVPIGLFLAAGSIFLGRILRAWDKLIAVPKYGVKWHVFLPAHP